MCENIFFYITFSFLRYNDRLYLFLFTFWIDLYNHAMTHKIINLKRYIIFLHIT